MSAQELQHTLWKNVIVDVLPHTSVSLAVRLEALGSLAPSPPVGRLLASSRLESSRALPKSAWQV